VIGDFITTDMSCSIKRLETGAALLADREQHSLNAALSRSLTRGGFVEAQKAVRALARAIISRPAFDRIGNARVVRRDRSARIAPSQNVA